MRERLTGKQQAATDRHTHTRHINIKAHDRVLEKTFWQPTPGQAPTNLLNVLPALWGKPQLIEPRRLTTRLNASTVGQAPRVRASAQVHECARARAPHIIFQAGAGFTLLECDNPNGLHRNPPPGC